MPTPASPSANRTSQVVDQFKKQIESRSILDGQVDLLIAEFPDIAEKYRKMEEELKDLSEGLRGTGFFKIADRVDTVIAFDPISNA